VKKNHIDDIESDTSEEEEKPPLNFPSEKAPTKSASKVEESFDDDEVMSVVLSM